jgi:uncharacterized membrane protein
VLINSYTEVYLSGVIIIVSGVYMSILSQHSNQPAGAYRRLLTAVLAGSLVGILASIFGEVKVVPLALWDTTAAVYVVWMWITIWPLTPDKSKQLAKREDPGKGLTDTILTLASLASLVAVGLILIEGSSGSASQKGLFAGFGVISVILSWALIHTIYTVKYAETYYSDPEGGVDFNQNTPPKYSDFAYLAFTVGMTFQVSDTNVKTNEMRRAIIHHAQLSYFFGTIIIATTINLVVGLSK